MEATRRTASAFIALRGNGVVVSRTRLGVSDRVLFRSRQLGSKRKIYKVCVLRQTVPHIFW
jgi:hypothetical protein